MLAGPSKGDAFGVAIKVSPLVWRMRGGKTKSSAGVIGGEDPSVKLAVVAEFERWFPLFRGELRQSRWAASRPVKAIWKWF